MPASSQLGAFAYQPAALGSTTTPGMNIRSVVEPTLVVATAATGTINFDAGLQSVIYFTASATANWTLNIRGSDTVRLDTLMQVGQTLTVAHMVTQGGTAYYNNALQIDGVSVTPKYQGGVAWSAGYASGVDIYGYVITKTGPATFTVFASQTQFK